MNKMAWTPGFRMHLRFDCSLALTLAETPCFLLRVEAKVQALHMLDSWHLETGYTVQARHRRTAKPLCTSALMLHYCHLLQGCICSYVAHILPCMPKPLLCLPCTDRPVNDDAVPGQFGS